jgi:hypothetical protein
MARCAGIRHARVSVFDGDVVHAGQDDPSSIVSLVRLAPHRRRCAGAERARGESSERSSDERRQTNPDERSEATMSDIFGRPDITDLQRPHRPEPDPAIPIGGPIADLEPDINWMPNMAVTTGISTGKQVGVYGQSKRNAGVYGESTEGIGVFGIGGRLAARFEGDVEVTGDIRLTNADCAEQFDVADASAAAPGTVLVLGPAGVLEPSERAYDKRVAGVVSGAGDLRPGVVLDSREHASDRMPVALVGKVFCKIDADYGAIEVGDLLTTSPTRGHAMKATDRELAFGSVIGKALRAVDGGRGLIPILVALQ